MSRVSPHQQALRLAQNLANGGALDYYLIGRLDNHEDRSGFEPIKEIYHYHAANEAAYTDNRSKANIALLKSDRSQCGCVQRVVPFLGGEPLPF